jgi:hypothetical protein
VLVVWGDDGLLPALARDRPDRLGVLLTVRSMCSVEDG